MKQVISGMSGLDGIFGGGLTTMLISGVSKTTITMQNIFNDCERR